MTLGPVARFGTHRLGQVRLVNKPGTFSANIHERGLHSRQHPYDLAAIDIAYESTAGTAFNMDFPDLPIFQQRYPHLPG